jgi:hypothetical protein
VKRRQCPDSEVRIIARQPGLRTIAVSSGLVNSAWAADEEDFERHFGIERTLAIYCFQCGFGSEVRMTDSPQQ